MLREMKEGTVSVPLACVHVVNSKYHVQEELSKLRSSGAGVLAGDACELSPVP